MTNTSEMIAYIRDHIDYSLIKCLVEEISIYVVHKKIFFETLETKRTYIFEDKYLALTK